MANYLTIILNVMVHLGILKKAEAEKLAAEFANKTLPADFESSFQLVKKIFEDTGIESKVVDLVKKDV